MPITIALAGNPNSGKTTLFNALTGSNQYVGNWPGVTVEKKEGKLKDHKDVAIMDLPGIYSLSPYTLEEVVARNYLINERPDAILNIVDGTNIERNLYLTTQLLELGIPVVVAVNMMDVVNRNKDKFDLDMLGEKLGCQVVPISALKGLGLIEAMSKAIEVAQKDQKLSYLPVFNRSVEAAIQKIADLLPADVTADQKRYYAIKLFERDHVTLEKLSLNAEIERIIVAVEDELDDDSESIITNERYTYITSFINDCFVRSNKDKLSTSDKIDRVLTNRWAALPIFAGIMFIVYFVSVTTVGTLLTDLVNDGVFGENGVPGIISSGLTAINAAPWVHGLVVDGIVAGVGAVLGFVPQIFVLFIFLAFLEGCGYMARVAFIMDKIFRRFGLSGKSFIPILIGTGCGIPGVMASRTIENDRDRKMTIITTTFIPCGAKLPIIALIAGALFGGAWWVAPSAYFIGIGAIIASGIILKKTKIFAGNPAPFVMELPAYHLPTVGNVLRSMWERGWSFIKKAGTIVLLGSMAIWFLVTFGVESGQLVMIEDMDRSLLAALGNAIAWFFIPLGFGDWQSAVATITGLVAKENVVSTVGILFGFAEVAEDGAEAWTALAAHFTAIAAYSFLIFNLLCAPCFAAIGAIRREMNNAKWTLFAISYQTGFAYVISMCFYQMAKWITTGVFGAGVIVSIILIIALIYLLVRPQPKHMLTPEIVNI
ncbi:MAG: ferrous iron transport protein B [Bacillota bacterium]|jgi:ferrous iron transport protein B